MENPVPEQNLDCISPVLRILELHVLKTKSFDNILHVFPAGRHATFQRNTISLRCQASAVQK